MIKAREEWLAEMLETIKQNPGIRPSKLNRLLKRPHTAALRTTLIKRGVIRKERIGAGVHYFIVK